MIDLYFCPTPNCWKVAIMLEEIGEPYRVIGCDISKGEQLSPEFDKLNLNHKVPVIVDHDIAEGEYPFKVFESGAILLYLANKYCVFYPQDVQGKSLVEQWLIWQMAGLGPMSGQANHFRRYAREQCEYSIARYSNEVRRLIHVLDNRLAEADYLAGDYSIADIAAWPWAAVASFIEIDINEFSNVKRWHDIIAKRPAVQRAYANAETAPHPHYLQTKAELSDEEWSTSYGEKQMASVRR